MKSSRFKLPKWLFTAALVWTLVIAISTVTFAETTGSLPQGVTGSGASTFSWTLSESSIIVTADTSSKTECGSTTYTPRDDTLILTSANKATLSISVLSITTVSGTGDGELTLNGEKFLAGSNKQFPLDENGTVTIKVTSGGTTSSASSTKFELSISYVPSGDNVTISFQPVTDIPYKVNSSTAITDNAAEVSGDPADGFSVVADDPHYICTGATLENGSTIPAVAGVISPTTSGKITPIFAYDWNADGVSPFKVGSTSYWDWDSAMTAANSSNPKVAVLNEDYTLPARTDAYEVPSGVTLLIPYNSSYTLCTTAPATVNESLDKPEVHRTLTMAENAKIVVNGGLSTGGTQNAQYKSNGQPHGPLGVIKMGANSNITVNKGGALYAWGYVVGSGTVTIESEGTVYEDFQVRDYRGGNVTSTLTSDQWFTDDDNIGTWHVFPFSQYYMQNVQVPMTLKAGAVEKGYFSVVAGSIQSETVPFIGADSMFQITDGYIIKDYNESTDRLEIDVYGSMEINEFSMTIRVQQLGSEITIKSSDYDLPLNSNITVELFGTSTVDLNQSMILLPGSEIIINEGTTLNVKSGKRLIVYDKDQWAWEGKGELEGYCSDLYKDVIPLAYVYTDTTIGAPKYARTVADLVDGRILVNGTLDASAGYLYTTEGGGNICSAGNGKVIMQTTPAANAYQIAQRRNTSDDFDKDEELDAHPITSAQLHNGDGTYDEEGNYNHDGSYVESASVGAGTYTYKNGFWYSDSWIILDAFSLDIEGEILMNLKFNLPEWFLNSESAYVRVTEEDCGINPDEIRDWSVSASTLKTVPAYDSETKTNGCLTSWDSGTETGHIEQDEEERYWFCQGIAAGEMTGKVTVAFYDGSSETPLDVHIVRDGTTESHVTRTVADFAKLSFDSATESNVKAKLSDMCQAMLTYGRYAQDFYDIAILAPSYALLKNDTRFEGKYVSIDDFDQNTVDKIFTETGSVDGCRVSEILLDLDSTIDMRVYFDTTNANLTYRVLRPGETGEGTPVDLTDGYVEIVNVPPAYWNDSYSIIVSDGTNKYKVTSSVYDWIRACLDQGTNDHEKNMAKAMYHYCTSAEAYFTAKKNAETT